MTVGYVSEPFSILDDESIQRNFSQMLSKVKKLTDDYAFVEIRYFEMIPDDFEDIGKSSTGRNVIRPGGRIRPGMYRWRYLADVEQEIRHSKPISIIRALGVTE